MTLGDTVVSTALSFCRKKTSKSNGLEMGKVYTLPQAKGQLLGGRFSSEGTTGAKDLMQE